MDGRLVAADLDVVGHDFVGTYLAGFEPTLRQHVDVFLMLLANALRLTERTGRARLTLLRGTEPYKARWHPVLTRNRRLLLANRPGPLPLGYAMAVRARAALADALRHRLPWLRQARRRLRQVAARTARARP